VIAQRPSTSLKREGNHSQNVLRKSEDLLEELRIISQHFIDLNTTYVTKWTKSHADKKKKKHELTPYELMNTTEEKSQFFSRKLQLQKTSKPTNGTLLSSYIKKKLPAT